jgi:hypothetical protein
MKFPGRPNSILARLAISGLGLWAAFAIGLVLYNRHRNGTEWDTLTDLFLLVVAVPIGIIAIAIALWAAGRHASKALVLTAIIGAAAIGAQSLYMEHLENTAIESSIRRADEHQARLEATYGGKCAPYRSTENPYTYSLCLKKEESDAQKHP